MDATRPSQTGIRRRRWRTAIVIGAVLVALYAGALTWVSERLEIDVARSIRPLPQTMVDHQHRAD